MILFAGLFGGFYEFSAMFMAEMLGIGLMIAYKKRGSLKIPKTIEFVGVLIITVMYLLTIFYGVDSGTSVSGVIKIVPVILFYMYWNNVSNQEKSIIWTQIPVTGTILTVVAIAVYPVESTREFLFRAQRLGGTFQYSNTYALFLLIGIIVLLYAEQWQLKEKIEIIVLIAGIIFTGSRSVTVLSAVIIGIHLIWKHNRKRLLIIGLAVFVAIMASMLIMELDIGRLLKLTLDSSTLNGRFLYWQDAIPLLWKHPFGLGYMGYYFLQPQIQTGNYVTKFVHNDFLQIGLDAGIIPLLIIICIVLKTLISKKTKRREKIVLLILSIHSLFDFDLQFACMVMIGIMCLEDADEKIVRKTNKIMMPAMAVTEILSLYFMVVFGLVYIEKYDMALKLYPYNTFAREERMQKELSVSDARWLIEKNGQLPDSYEVLIQNKCKKGTMDGITADIEQMLDHAGYQAEYYDQAVYYLSIALDNAVRSGDRKESQKILKTIQHIPDKIEEKCNQSSKLAYKIHDKPEIKLDASIQNYLDKISNVTLEQN